jgi:hypothetical protein
MPKTTFPHRRSPWLPRGFVRQAGCFYAGEHFGYDTEDFTEDGWITLKTEEVNPFEFFVIRQTGVLAANRLSIPHSADELLEEALPYGLISAGQMTSAYGVSREIVRQRWFSIYSLARWLMCTYHERYDW